MNLIEKYIDLSEREKKIIKSAFNNYSERTILFVRLYFPSASVEEIEELKKKIEDGEDWGTLGIVPRTRSQKITPRAP